jgi:plasmid stabilization system protein ParE
MNYRVIITRRAERDMQNAAAWWAKEHSPEQADRWLSGLDECLRSLGQTPMRCPLAAENDLVQFEIRELHYGAGRRPTHRAIFSIAEELVLVLAVRHSAQDRLRPDDFSI